MFAQFLVVGLISGAIYSLIALGIVIVYRSTRVLNFAHAAIGVFVAFLALDLMQAGWSYYAVVPAALVLAALIGLALERLVMRRMAGNPQGQTIATLGLFIFVQAVLGVVWGNMWGQRFPSPFGGTFKMPGVDLYVSYDQVVVVVAVVAVATGLYHFLRHTGVGLSIRAAADDPLAARLCGVGVHVVQPVVWVLAAVLGTLAVVLLAPITLLENTTLTLIMIKGMTAAVVGRLVSFPLTVAGGLALGVAESMSDAYVQVSWFKEGLSFLFVLALLVYQVASNRRSTQVRIA